MSKCRCNCHDPDARKAMGIIEHKTHRQCHAAIKRLRKWLKKRELQLMREHAKNA